MDSFSPVCSKFLLCYRLVVLHLQARNLAAVFRNSQFFNAKHQKTEWFQVFKVFAHARNAAMIGHIRAQDLARPLSLSCRSSLPNLSVRGAVRANTDLAYAGSYGISAGSCVVLDGLSHCIGQSKIMTSVYPLNYSGLANPSALPDPISQFPAGFEEFLYVPPNILVAYTLLSHVSAFDWL
jgi:hypothetical protein